MRRHLLITTITVLLISGLATAQQRGISGREAPSWGVEQWFNLPSDQSALDIDDFDGQVVYLYCFQSWCPGCHSRGFPTLKRVMKRYQNADDVSFVAVQTAFEGFSTNTLQAAKQTAERYDLDIPVGHSGSPERRSTLMRRYRTGGTPWTIIIDKNGTVRYDDFHIQTQQANTLIDRLRQENAEDNDATNGDVPTLPAERGGQDRVGDDWPDLDFDRWLQTPEKQPAETKKKVTLYRWWTDGCPYCRASLPAIQKLRKKYKDEKDFQTVAVYHPKPPRRVNDDDLLTVIRQTRYDGPVAVDRDWSELRTAYLAHSDRRATSVSLLVDVEGKIRFVHPGPVLFPSDDPRYEQENEDYEKLDRAINVLLREAKQKKDTSKDSTRDAGASDTDDTDRNPNRSN